MKKFILMLMFICVYSININYVSANNNVEYSMQKSKAKLIDLNDKKLKKYNEEMRSYLNFDPDIRYISHDKYNKFIEASKNAQKTKINLKNGDYYYLYHSRIADIIFLYNQHDQVKGYVYIKVYKHTKRDSCIVFYDYRILDTIPVKVDAEQVFLVKLAHVMVLKTNPNNFKKKYLQFVYKTKEGTALVDSPLKYARINDSVYINAKADNLFINLEGLFENSEDFYKNSEYLLHKEKYSSRIKKIKRGTIDFILGVFFLVPPLGMLFEDIIPFLEEEFYK